MAKSKATKKSKSSAAKADGGGIGGIPPFLSDADVSIDVQLDGVGAPSVDPLSGAVEIPGEDGDVIIDFNPQPLPKSTKFDDNLAEYIENGILGGLAGSLLDAIDEDERDRADWINQRAEGIDLLGLKLERPGGSVGASSAPLDGMSRVRDPILLDAVLNAQATAYAELCPSEGPCKAVNYGDETTDNDKLAEELEKDYNYFFTNTASEYYPDTRNMLGMTVYASGMFKKVYRCPLRQRPVSESVDGADLIIPSNATDLKNAPRVTHQIDMDQRVMRIMQKMGVYRDVSLTTPNSAPNVLDVKRADVAGLDAKPQRQEDQTYTIYECYCALDLEGFEHLEGGGKKGEPTGIPLPYRVTIDKDSRTILEIRRNWREGDPGFENGNVQAKIPFVAFPYVTAGFAGIYGIGLLHILGNITMALTALVREGIDAGMFANFPGGLIAKGATRQLSNEIRVAPGTLAPVDITGAQGGRIQDAIMALPYKDVTPGLMSLMGALREVGTKLGGSAEVPVGEGVQNTPVGSVLAAIEQATKVESSVHKSFHAAQKEEFSLFQELFKEDPESLWRDNKRPALGVIPAGKSATEEQVAAAHKQRVERFKQALENCEIVPASDPNVPSHIHRLAKANTYLQTAMQMPGVFNMQRVVSRWASMVKIDDIQSDFAPQQGQPPPDPKAVAAMISAQARMLDSQTKQGQLQISAKKVESDTQLKKDQLASKENIEASKIAHQASSALPQSDPNQEALLALKSKQLSQKDQEMAFKAYDSHQNRETKLSVEALKVAQTVGVHPDADPIVDQQLNQMSGLITPAKSQGQGGSMAMGGKVDADDQSQAERELYHRALGELAEALLKIVQQKPDPQEKSVGGPVYDASRLPPFTYTVN